MVKDRLSAWFMRNIIKPRMERLDMPGYVTSSVGDISDLRELFLPETLLVEVENSFVEKYDGEGRERLYLAGKRFGHRYARLSQFPRAGSSSKIKFRKFFDFFVKYIEATYSSSIEYSLDVDSVSYSMETEDYVVCRRNGKGHVLTEGAVAGVLSYMFEDGSVDAKHDRCQGSGADSCTVVSSPDVEGPGFQPEVNISDSKWYREINRVEELKQATKSMQDLLDSGFFSYSEGHLMLEDERFVLPAASLPYILEEELSVLEDSPEIMFGAARRAGEELSSGRELSFVPDLLSATGWGGVRIVDGGDTVKVARFPWTSMSEDSEYLVFRGYLSGLVSGCTGMQRNFQDFESNQTTRGLSLELSSG